MVIVDSFGVSTTHLDSTDLSRNKVKPYKEVEEIWRGNFSFFVCFIHSFERFWLLLTYNPRPFRFFFI